MDNTPVLTDFDFQRLRAIYIKSGLHEELGGIDALDEGLRELFEGALPVVGELLKVERRREALADAVRDPVRYPHLTLVHGFCRDLMVLGMPGEFVPWVERFFATVRPEDLRGLSKQIVQVAMDAGNPAKAALFKLLCFEMLCVVEWIGLRFSGTRLEVLDADPGTVEILAEREVEIMLVHGTAYHEALPILEDPIEVLSHAVLTCLDHHLDDLRAALQDVSKETRERLEARRQILKLTDKFTPEEAVIIRNEVADAFDEPQYGATEMIRMHPVMLRNIGQSAYYKRRSKLFESLEPGDPGPRPLRCIPVKQKRQPSLADLLLARKERLDD